VGHSCNGAWLQNNSYFLNVFCRARLSFPCPFVYREGKLRLGLLLSVPLVFCVGATIGWEAWGGCVNCRFQFCEQDPSASYLTSLSLFIIRLQVLKSANVSKITQGLPFLEG